MRWLVTTLQIGAIVLLVGGATVALTRGDTTPRETARAASLTEGAGMLDGMTFATMLAPEGKPGAIRDAMFFRDGLFLSLECEDRCNYPPSAYYAREIAGGHEFVVEAWCPTKDATMVWRGRIEDGAVSGTVTWTVRRFYRRVGTVLEFTGNAASEDEVALWRP